MSSRINPLKSFVTEKIVGRGEDGDPIAYPYSDLGDVVAVFDGMGGSGATQVPVDSSVTALTEPMCSMAYLASRVASRTVSQVLGQLGVSNLSKLKSQIEVAVKAELTKLVERPGGQGAEPRLRGTILAEYPTTIALAVVSPPADEFNWRHVNVYWAGDSRVYAFDPDRLIPLQLLTRDHTDEGGGGDAALKRFASSTKLDLDHREYDLPPSSAVIAMSDGCYAYMSPLRLMFLLTQEMRFARNSDEWILAIRSRISSVAQDDTSFAISFGEGGFDALRERLTDYYLELSPLMYIPERVKPNRLVLPHNSGQFEELFDENERRRSDKLKLDTGRLEPSVDEKPLIDEKLVSYSAVEFDVATEAKRDRDSSSEFGV